VNDIARSLTRRRFVQLATAAGTLLRVEICRGDQASGQTISLFDGHTLNGWLQIENSATSFSGSSITDLADLAHKLTSSPDSDPDTVSTYLRSQLGQPLIQQLSTDTAAGPDTKSLQSTLAKALNAVISGPALYDTTRFASVTLRPETTALLRQSPQGYDLERLNKLLLEDAYPNDLARSASAGWIVKDGVMASTGSGRGVIYTAQDFSRYRLMFTMRHVSGSPDHQACVLIFCTRPLLNEKPLDALGGIQFQVPNGGHWDYRPGKNNAGGQEFTNPIKPHFDVHSWSRVEILADASTGTARMAVAQPPGSKGIEVLDFNDPAAGKIGPIAFQMHNAGLFDEYKEVTIELNPKTNDLVLLR